MDEPKNNFPSEETPSDAITLEDGSTVSAASVTPPRADAPTTPQSAPMRPQAFTQHTYYGNGYRQQPAPAPRPSFYPPYGVQQTGSLIPPRETAQSRFSEHPGGNWVRPVERTPEAPAAPIVTKKHAGGTSLKLITLMLCLCILLSGVSGFVGVLIGQRLSPAGGVATTVMWETGPSTPIPNGTTESDALIAAVTSARRSVVEITTETIVSGSFFGQSVQSGAGSGVIITNDGYIVTNHHVIDGASTITVRLENGESYAATLRGTDSETDLAIIKINVTSPLTPAQWGRSEDLQAGQRVFAIGNPLGTLGGSVSDGIISALDRDITVGGVPMTLLQTNAAVNPGNSGGGLFNLAGQLIGIVNAKYSDESLEGLGFAIPQKIASIVAEDLISQGYVSGRPQLGLHLVNVTANNLNDVRGAYPALATYINSIAQYGVYVSKTEGAVFVSGSLQMGDYLETIDGKKITSFADVQSVLRSHRVGDEIVVKVRRINVTDSIEVTVRLTQKTVTTSLD